MMRLMHHPFCPHSRYVRLLLFESGIEMELVEEKTWERREEFLLLNPAGTTPVLITDKALPVPGAAVIAEFVDDVAGAGYGRPRPPFYQITPPK
jgi:glutathione S-transferase